MKPTDIRQSYLDFFEERDHRVVPSSPVVPEGDPTLLFTNAGMNQFKDLLLGNEERDYKRATSSQKCIRAGGKHNDLDEVGKDGRHLTFFEMLGNWSFGDYYKRQAIEWSWEFVLDVLELDKDRLYVTIYLDDDESFGIWTEHIGLHPDRVLRLGEDENFWSMGPTGPCGPCTEIHYDLHPERGDFDFVEGYDEERINEIWNLVFMEFDRDEEGNFNPLPLKSVDTGMGLERVAMIKAGRDSVFHTNLFTPIFRTLFKLLGEDPDQDLDQFYARDDFTSFAVIADHIRTLTFAICDGAQFSNEGRGYVLRRVLRRAVRFGRTIGFSEPFMHQLVPAMVEYYGDSYPELQAMGTEAAELIRLDEESFFRNLDRGLELFEDTAEEAQAQGRDELSGEEVFELHATFGFPPDLIEIMAEERQMTIDWEGYQDLWEEHREKSRGKDVHADAAGVGDWKTIHDGPADEFVGYDRLRETTQIQKVRHLDGDEYELLLRKTPFYAESGGQIGDTGVIAAVDNDVSFEITDTQQTPMGIVHRARRKSGEVTDDSLGDEFTASVDERHRQKTACNHTATHLLHAALREEISDSIFQAGSLVAPDRLRFDFRHGEALGDDELRQLEERVNQRIRARHPVVVNTDVERDEAVEEMGAMAIFGEKYGDTVRVVQIPGESVELCGGIHVENTGDIGAFRITSESSVGSGIRRIEAVTEEEAFDTFDEERQTLEKLAGMLKADSSNLEDRLQALIDEKNDLERQVDSLSQKLADRGASEMVDDAAEVDGVAVIAQVVDVDDRDQMLAYADKLREQLGDREAAILLGARIDSKAALACLLTDSTFETHRIKAGDLINVVAEYVDGRGGGRPTLAQAGGSKPDGLSNAIDAFADAVADALSK